MSVAHTFLFREGDWQVAGEFTAGDGSVSPADGEARIKHLSDRWLFESVMRLRGAKTQVAGDLNAVVVGWNEAAGNVSSVTDSAGNAYQLAAPTVRGSGLSQAVYYAKSIGGAAAGANTVTVKFDKAVTFADIRILEYGGLDRTSPLDVSRSAA